MNNKPVSTEEIMETLNENRNFIEFIGNGIETGNPEVINNISLSALSIACTNSPSSNLEKEIHPTKPNVHGSELNTNMTNDQRILKTFQARTSPENETGKEGLFPSDENEIRNIGDRITREINEPKNYQTNKGNQISGINYENMQTSQDLLQNFESGNKAPCIDVLSTLRNDALPSDLNTAKTDYACNRKRNASSYKALEDNSQAPKRSKDEFLTNSNQYFASCSKESSINYDFSWKESAINQMTIQSNRMTSIDEEFQTIKQFPSLNEGMQVLGDVGKNALFVSAQSIASNSSFSEIVQNNHGLILKERKISDYMTSNSSTESMLTDQGQYSYPRNVNNPNVCTENAFQAIKDSPFHNQGMQVLGNVGKNTIFTYGQPISFNTRIAEIARNDHGLIKISDSMISNCSRENMLADPVSTGYHWNENNPNLLGESLQSLHQAGKGEELPCKVCKAKIANHEQENAGNSHYECCICMYNDKEPSNLHMHSYTHVPYCIICLKVHYEGASHDGSKTCTVPSCNEILLCRTQLIQHLLGHEKCILGHCWHCLKGFSEHHTIDEGKTFYKCCLCLYKTIYIRKWEEHTNRHRPKWLCQLCKEYPEVEKGSHQKEFSCIACKKNFKCKGLFEQHDTHEIYLKTNCILCDKELYDHKVSDQGNIFKCCKCPKSEKVMSKLSIHIYNHIDFLVYKCDPCGRRFKLKSYLVNHSESCSAVPYKCETCQARFPLRHFLDLHISVKHIAT